MPDYIRANVPGGTFFFTVVTHCRKRIFSAKPASEILADVIRECQHKWPFEIDAMVLLPDHLHCIWSLPAGDPDYSLRWSWLKKEFTKRWLSTGVRETSVSAARIKERRRGFWQPRFWEHTIQNEHDFERHFDYIHYNPVKHGLVQCPRDWPDSSFHRWVTAGVYPADWACWKDNEQSMSFSDIARTVGE